MLIGGTPLIPCRLDGRVRKTDNRRRACRLFYELFSKCLLLLPRLVSHQRRALSVSSKDNVETGQVDSRLKDQGCNDIGQHLTRYSKNIYRHRRLHQENADQWQKLSPKKTMIICHVVVFIVFSA